MLLAQLLILRKSTNDEISALTSRLFSGALVQEGSKVQEDMDSLITKLSEKTELYRKVDLAISHANLSAVVEVKLVPDDSSEAIISKTPLLDLIVARDTNKRLYQIFSTFADRLVPDRDRFSRNEIKSTPTWEYLEARNRADAYSKRFRELDTIIQQANWSTDVDISHLKIT